MTQPGSDNDSLTKNYALVYFETSLCPGGMIWNQQERRRFDMLDNQEMF